MKIILGSASKRRQRILREMGYDFEIMTADIDEKSIRHDDASKLTKALAHAKADALISKLPKDSILITADLVAVFDGRILEKPESKAEAIQTLESFRDKPVETVCSVVATNAATGQRAEGVDIAKIWFKPFTEDLYRDFVDTGKVFEHAGSFAAEDPLFEPFVDRIEGTIESIAGLPKELTKRLIEKVS